MLHDLEEELTEESALLGHEMARVKHMAFVNRRIVDNTQRKVLAEVKEKIRSDTFALMKAESETCLQVQALQRRARSSC